MAVEQVIKISLDDLKALGGIDNLKKSLGETEQSTKSLKQQLREATAEVAQMAEKYGEASKETVQAAKRAAELKDRIEDANDAIMAFKGEGAFLATGKALQSVASGFAAAQGAMGLFGSESENVEKAILKVQSAMALAQGLEGLEDAGRAFTQLKTVAVNAFNGIKAAIGGIGIGLLVIALGTLVAKWDDISEALSGASKEQDLFNRLQKEAINQSAKEIQDLDILYRTTQNHALSIDERKKAVDRLQSTYPGYFANIQDEIILNGGAVKSYQNLRLAILDAARAKAAQSELDKRAQERLQKELDLQEKLNKQLEIYRNPKPIQSVSVGSTGGSRTFVSAETVKNDAKAAAFALIQEQKKLRDDAQKEDSLLLGIIQKGTIDLGKASENKGKEIVQGFKRGLTNPTDVNNNRNEVKDKVNEVEKEPINPATGNTYKSELESLKAFQSAQTQAKLDQLNLEDQINTEAYEREKEAARKRIELKQYEEDAKYEIANQAVELANSLGIKSKAVANALLLIEKGLAISQIISNASRAIATATANLAATPAVIGVIPNPMYPVQAAATAKGIASTKISAGLSIANILAQTVTSLNGASSIKSGVSSAVGAGGVGNTIPQPQFNVAGNAGVNQIASTLANQPPVKAYVVGKEVSTQQSLDRNIVKNATLG